MPLNPALGRHSQAVTPTAEPRRRRDFGRVSLAPSGLNEARPIHLSRLDQLGYLIMIPTVGLCLWSPKWGVALSFTLYGALFLLASRNQRDAFFNCARVHGRQGLLGLQAVDVPLESIQDVVVEPVRMLPGMGTIIVKYGVKHLQFECVPDAESRAEQLRAAIRVVQPKGHNQGAAQQSI